MYKYICVSVCVFVCVFLLVYGYGTMDIKFHLPIEIGGVVGMSEFS